MAKLTAGGEEGPCGWLKDRFGLSWQVYPTVVSTLIADPDPGKTQRTVAAVQTMTTRRHRVRQRKRPAR